MFESPTDSQRAKAGSLRAAALGFITHMIGFISYGLMNRDLSLFEQQERFILYSLINFVVLHVVRLAARKRREDVIKALGCELPRDVAIVAPKSQASPDEKTRDLGLKYWHGQLAMHFMAGSLAFWIGGMFYLFFLKRGA